MVIEMRPDLAPNHVAHIKKLAREGQYDGVVFHRVIEGFMAQTGDVKHGKSADTSGQHRRVGLSEFEAGFFAQGRPPLAASPRWRARRTPAHTPFAVLHRLRRRPGLLRQAVYGLGAR